MGKIVGGVDNLNALSLMAIEPFNHPLSLLHALLLLFLSLHHHHHHHRVIGETVENYRL
jgi:hypothetical protein